MIDVVLIQQKLLEALEQAKNDLNNAYNSSGKKTSGEFGNSLEINIRAEENRLVGELDGASYYYQMVHGRKPGRKPPFLAIEKWVKQKGLIAKKNETQSQMVYAIMNKIAKKGFPGDSRLDIFNENYMDNLLKEVNKTIFDSITFKTINANNK
jgi:hypothetical protein